jgi:RNA polymerase sigma factor (sigma-70 family)
VPSTAVLGYLYRTAAGTAFADLTDADLVGCFAANAGAAEVAFAALVRRHGPTVLRVCQDLLRDPRDAEDVFQATFLVLATKAPSLRLRGPLGPWLCEVARRIAARARAAYARRLKHEQRAAVPEARAAEFPDPDVAALVHGALAKLPERFRLPVVLCDLQGMSYREAAECLGWCHDSVRSRLARGRQRLRGLLRRTGLAPAVAALASATAPQVPRTLAATTVRAAVMVAGGWPVGGVRESVILLTSGGLSAMFLTKLKMAGLSAVTAGVLIAGAVGLSAQPPGQNRAAPDVPQGQVARFEEVLALALEQAQVSEGGDPADRISRLAHEAKRRHQAGDAEGAMKLLRQMDDASWAWQGEMRQQRGAPAAGAAEPQHPATDPATLSRWLGRQVGQQSRPIYQETPTRTGATAASASTATRGAADVEARLQALEAKMDRLLRALEGPKDGGRYIPPNQPKQ